MRDTRIAGVLFCVPLLVLILGVAPAQASRTLRTETAVKTTHCANCPRPTEDEELNPIPPAEGQIEGPCGLAISNGSDKLYVSDYYHRQVDVYSLGGGYQSQIVLPGSDPIFEVALDGVCGLAVDSAGRLYANEFHERVLRLTPTEQVFDPVEPIIPTNESTGVAVDGKDRVYVDDRKYVAVYEPSGAPVLREGQPLRIGFGSLDDAYGLAVSHFAGTNGDVYVPDAADGTIEVYEPDVEPLEPAFTIDGPGTGDFTSLVDAAVAIDPTNGHLLVVDNTQPGYEHPEAAIYEFDASGAFLGRLSGGKDGGPTYGGPSGLAVDPASGELFVTDGNGEESNVFAYGPYVASGSLATPPSGTAPGDGGLAAAGRDLPARPSSAPSTSTAASASEVVQHGGVRVNFDGKLTPRALPRHGAAPVGIAVDAKIAATGDGVPPQLRKIAIEINRNGQFTTQGLSVCRLQDIQPSTTANALAACRGSLVGEGHFSANVKLPEQSPFPSEGKVLAFNGRLRGQPAILAHIYGTEPAPTSTVLPFLIKTTRGTYGTTLEASLPQATGSWGYVTGLRMTLRRKFAYRGRGRSYLSAGCPAPAGFRRAIFPLARTSFSFAGGPTLVSTLEQSCKAKG